MPFSTLLTRSTSFQHEWMRRAAEAVDVAVRDAHAQEIQPEYDSYNRVATLSNSMGVHSSWPHSGLTLRIRSRIQLGDLAFLLFRFYSLWYFDSTFYSTSILFSMVHLGAARGPSTYIRARVRAASTDIVFHPPHARSTRDTLLPTLSSAGIVVGAHAAGLDRQTDAASGAYCLLQPQAGRPLFTRSKYP